MWLNFSIEQFGVRTEAENSMKVCIFFILPRSLEILNKDNGSQDVDITSFIDHEEQADAFIDASLIYSGYMNMGEKMLAVINGIEYRIGDIVEGFTLKEIDPVEIVMEKNGRPARIPFQRLE